MAHRSTGKIILNYLPPAKIHSPSIALSILQAFLQHHGLEAQVKYWNILFYDFVNAAYAENDYVQLLPFLYLLADNAHDRRVTNRLLTFYQMLFPAHKFAVTYEAKLRHAAHEKLDRIQTELGAVDFSDVMLFGICAKFHAWIPGTILAAELKRLRPDIKIIIGGFHTREMACAVMDACGHFDFALWGEGEYPLLALGRQMAAGERRFEKIPRLLYREGNCVKKSSASRSRMFAFDETIMADYTDYFSVVRNRLSGKTIALPVESNRGCRWNSCRFCTLNQGYAYREKQPAAVVKELMALSRMHGITRFIFVDNDIAGDVGRFNELLDLLIDLRHREQIIFELSGELSHAGLSSQTIEKMVSAGFVYVQIGYEAVTDALLKKMNKKNSVADNILFVKSALRHGLKFRSNIIVGIPDETEEDIAESIDNLHFLRFYLSDEEDGFRHTVSPFVLEDKSPYFRAITRAEKKPYNSNPIAELLPEALLTPRNKYALFSFARELRGNQGWNQWQLIEKFYRKTTATYEFSGIDDASVRNGFLCKEYLEGKLIKTLRFDGPVYGEILRQTNYAILTLEQLLAAVRSSVPDISAAQLEDKIGALREAYLLYHNKELTEIVAIPDTAQNDLRRGSKAA